MYFMQSFIEVGWTIMKFGLVVTGLTIVFGVFVLILQAFASVIFSKPKSTNFATKRNRSFTIVGKEDDKNE